MAGFYIPGGNDARRDDIPVLVELIECIARWVNPETFRRLPVRCPHTARGQPLYDAGWTRRCTNTRKATSIKPEEFEGNVAALQALVAALDVASNWTDCHIWGYDDPSFAQQSSIFQDPRYFSCVASMVWLPTPLKGLTDYVARDQSDFACMCVSSLRVGLRASFCRQAEQVRSG